MRQMMSLGGFVFSLSEGTPYEGLQRTSDGGWVAVARYGQKLISQDDLIKSQRQGSSVTLDSLTLSVWAT
ncbi:MULTISPECIES: hypothetical protein [Marinomonas]|uniref:hypothetical protein n=1 Tax=Marinomonas TaxID=28253 RepID=UPI0019A7B555|nr:MULTISPECIES: hypothetical protein [Marinomonas]MCS7488707.1 hypothetical protein [Marinomonas sp. BSi20414]GGN37565.1 hypothetical protein GCM10011350_36940 [Marinomonas arctica]